MSCSSSTESALAKHASFRLGNVLEWMKEEKHFKKINMQTIRHSIYVFILLLVLIFSSYRKLFYCFDIHYIMYIKIAEQLI